MSSSLKKQCLSVTLHGERCRNHSLPAGRYCWRHIDLGGSAILSLVISALLAILIVMYQDRSPDVTAVCGVPPDGDPSNISCTVSNSGRKEAREVSVSFNSMLPVGTVVANSPEYATKIEEATTPPDPFLSRPLADSTKAFSVQITRVLPHHLINFTVSTVDADNLRAGKQSVYLSQIGERILLRFWDKLRTAHPDRFSELDTNLVLQAEAKQRSFFLPALVSFELGSRPVTFLTDSEKEALAIHADLYARFKSEFIDLFRGRQYNAPVVRIKTVGGDSTYAIFPPYISTIMVAPLPMDSLIREGQASIRPPIPRRYDAELEVQGGQSFQRKSELVPFTKSPVRLDGAVGPEWSRALVGSLFSAKTEGKAQTHLADLDFLHDGRRLYIAVDFLASTSDGRPTRARPWGDYVKLIFDVNSDGVAGDGDLQFAMSQGSGVLFCRGLKGLQPSGPPMKIRSRGFMAFRASRRQPIPHRIWELSLDLADVKFKPGQRFGLGVSIHAEQDQMTLTVPKNLGDQLPEFVLQPP